MSGYPERLRRLRGNKSRSEVANAIDVDYSTIYLYECGKRVPSDTNKVKLAEYFGVSVQELFFDDWQSETSLGSKIS